MKRLLTVLPLLIAISATASTTSVKWDTNHFTVDAEGEINVRTNTTSAVGALVAVATNNVYAAGTNAAKTYTDAQVSAATNQQTVLQIYGNGYSATTNGSVITISLTNNATQTLLDLYGTGYTVTTNGNTISISLTNVGPTELAAATNGTVAKAVAANHSTNFWGQLNVTNFNSGTAASGTTYWRGDGTWGTPSGAGDVTTAQLQSATNVILQTSTNSAKTYADTQLLSYQLGNATLTNLFGRTPLTNGHSASVTFSNDVHIYGRFGVTSPDAAGTNANIVNTGWSQNEGNVTNLSPVYGTSQTNSGVIKASVFDGNATSATTATQLPSGTTIDDRITGATNGTVAKAVSAVNATNLHNANLPVPTNSPTVHSRVVATSASTAAWVVGDLVATNTTGAIDFAVPMSEFETNDVPQLLAPANVNVGRYGKSTVFITNSLQTAKSIILPAGVRTNSAATTLYVTNVTAVTVYCIGGRWTNAICFPLW